MVKERSEKLKMAAKNKTESRKHDLTSHARKCSKDMKCTDLYGSDQSGPWLLMVNDFSNV